MNWFQRHLNWTWVFAYLIWIPLNLSHSITLWIIGDIFLLVVSGWVIKQKGRSLWWIFLTPVFSPLWLKNKSLVNQNLPTITDEERQECLAYYAEEKRLRLLYEKVEQLFDKRFGEYEDAYFKARKEWRRYGWDEDRDPMSIMAKISDVHEYFSRAATEIVNRKKAMRPAPLATSAMCSAWFRAYLDYEALRHAPMVAGSDAMEVKIRETRAKELFANYKKAIQRAWNEEREFRRRINLSGGEYQKIVDYAAIAVDADEWLRKLEAEFP